MIEEGKDAWTLFFFQKRSKTWVSDFCRNLSSYTGGE
jgi:hypothetical protein